MTKQEFCAAQDHSCLGWACPRPLVDRYIEEVLEYGFASIMVNPDQVAYCASRIEGRAGVGAVIGFPQGFHSKEIKIAEGLEALKNGATDLDCVTNFSLLADGKDAELLTEYRDFVNAAKDVNPDTVVKFIMYKPYCSEPVLDDDQTRRVAELIMQSGADYIKFCGSFPLIKTLCEGKIKMKHSGCATFQEAIDAIQNGCSRIGHDSAVTWLKSVDDSFWTK